MISNRFFMVTALALVLLFQTAHPYPVNWQQVLASKPNTWAECDSVAKYTTNYFLEHTKPEFKREIHDEALFYSRGMSLQAQKLACNTGRYITVWDVWPPEFYNTKQTHDNPLRCIHNESSSLFFEHMSEAFARMARKHATVMHSFSDYASPPQDGIWARIELPAIRDTTDIFQMNKINEDRSLTSIFSVPQKAAKAVFEKSMRELNHLFGQTVTGNSVSCTNIEVSPDVDALF